MKTAFDYGFVKVAACSPRVAVANPDQNAGYVLEAIAAAAGAQVIALPELCLSGYTCADLFHQDRLIRRCEAALGRILAETAGNPAVIALGMPVRSGNALYNCAVILQNGRILGAVPKEYLPNYQEFYEKRWFEPAPGEEYLTVTLCGRETFLGVEIGRAHV